MIRNLMKNISIVTPLMMGILVSVVYFWLSQDLVHYDPILLQAIIKKSAIQPKPPNRNSTLTYSWPKCEQDTSVSSISDFSLLTQNIQDFLYYRHCRHFPMILDAPDKCGGIDEPADVFLLLVIKSSPVNFDRREALRKTWAKERLQNGVWIRRIFISGTTGDGYEKKRLNKLLELEQRENNDILQWDFVDSRYNLTLKQILFLEWMDINCPHVRFLMNSNDDVLAHTDNIVAYLESLKDNDGSKHLYIGQLRINEPPSRDSSSEYYVPVQVYEPESYPDFISGEGFLVSGFTAHVMYNMSHSITIFPMYDVYIAMCAAEAGLHPEHHVGMMASSLRTPSNTDPLDPCFFREILLAHDFSPLNLYLMWESLHNPGLKC